MGRGKNERPWNTIPRILSAAVYGVDREKRVTAEYRRLAVAVCFVRPDARDLGNAVPRLSGDPGPKSRAHYGRMGVSMKTVVIVVDGGVATPVYVPWGVLVEIVDMANLKVKGKEAGERYNILVATLKAAKRESIDSGFRIPKVVREGLPNCPAH